MLRFFYNSLLRHKEQVRPEKNEMWHPTKFLAPQEMMSIESRRELTTLVKLVDDLPRLNDNINAIDDEWRSLNWASLPDALRYPKCDIVTFYTQLMDFKDRLGQNKFRNLAHFALQF